MALRGRAEKLLFYGLYKQATDGNNNTPQPSFFDAVNRAKWCVRASASACECKCVRAQPTRFVRPTRQAWREHFDKPPHDAMRQYVDLVTNALARLPPDDARARDFRALLDRCERARAVSLSS